MHQGSPQDENRVTPQDLERLSFNQYRYLSGKRSLVSPTGVETRLRSKTRQVFEILASQADGIVSKDELINLVWGDVIVTDDTLNQSIREIRKALGDTERKVLETVSRQGYILHAVKKSAAEETNPTAAQKKRLQNRPVLPLIAAAVLCVLGISYGLMHQSTDTEDTTVASATTASNSIDNTLNNNTEIVTPQALPIAVADSSLSQSVRENLEVSVELTGSIKSERAEDLVRSVVSELSRYSNIDPTQSQSTNTDYKLELYLHRVDSDAVNLQLHYLPSNELVLSENITFEQKNIASAMLMAGRVAALIGSPAGGAIGHHLMKVSRSKSAQELSRPECLAHGYGCTSCSGEFDTISQKAVQCIARILENDPTDPDAWALQSTILSRQYLWGSSLQEPLRTNKDKRHHLKSKAIEAATRAEALADGNNPSVYWGMVQAYLASCDADKAQVAIERGLNINPNDPNMLAVYGNFLSYVGKWDQGKELVQQAQHSDLRFFKNWWYMAEAKWYYRRGEYQQAYDIFIKSFNERNWLSHLQLAYTLPHLGRIEEAKQALEDFMRVAPAMTREHVYEFYNSYCFDDEFLNRVKTAFDLIDMPSRGSGDNFDEIRPISASVERIADRTVEYVDVGDGIPLLFVHGSMSDYRTWGYMLLPMSERHRFLSYSLRYFGTLDWPEGKIQFDENVDAQDLISFIEHKNLGPVYLVGWSRSGSITSMVARARPDLVKGLIVYEPVLNELLDPETNPDAVTEGRLNFSRVADYVEKGDPESAVKVFFETALERKPGEFFAEPTALQRVLLDNARTVPLNFSEPAPNQPVVNCDYIKEIKVPGLILYGENTNPPWQYMSTRFAECMPQGQALAVRDANHDGPLSQPRLVTDHINRFIDSVEITAPEK